MEPYLILLTVLVLIPGVFTMVFPSFRGLRWDPRRDVKLARVSMHSRRAGDHVGVPEAAQPFAPRTRNS